MTFDDMLSFLAAFSFLLNLVLGFFVKIVWNRFSAAEKSIKEVTEVVNTLTNKQNLMEATYLTKEDFSRGIKEVCERIESYSKRGDDEDKKLSESVADLNSTLTVLKTQLEEQRRNESKH